MVFTIDFFSLMTKLEQEDREGSTTSHVRNTCVFIRETRKHKTREQKLQNQWIRNIYGAMHATLRFEYFFVSESTHHNRCVQCDLLGIESWLDGQH